MIKYANGSKDQFNEPANIQPAVQITNEDSFEQLAETAPEYPYGEKGLAIYLAQNLRFPKSAQKKGIQGQVILRFLVKENGSISDIQLIKGIDWDCNHEAVRLVEKMPKWIPAKLNGKPVKTYYNLPINFKL